MVSADHVASVYRLQKGLVPVQVALYQTLYASDVMASADKGQVTIVAAVFTISGPGGGGAALLLAKHGRGWLLTDMVSGCGLQRVGDGAVTAGSGAHRGAAIGVWRPHQPAVPAAAGQPAVGLTAAGVAGPVQSAGAPCRRLLQIFWYHRGACVTLHMCQSLRAPDVM